MISTIGIISQLNKKNLSEITQTSHKFNLAEQCREYLYSKEDFETLLVKKDIAGIRWLAKHHPERKCPSFVIDWASKNGHTEIVRLLLAAQKEYTCWALDWASGNGHIEVVKLLLAAGAMCTTLAFDWASGKGHIKVVKLLLKAPNRSTAPMENCPQGSSLFSDCTTDAFDYA